MGYIATVHHPSLTVEERSARMEIIKQATVKFYKEVMEQIQRENNQCAS